MDGLRVDDLVLVEGEIIEVGENSQGDVAYRIAFPNGHHFWIDAEHVAHMIERVEENGQHALRVLNQR